MKTKQSPTFKKNLKHIGLLAIFTAAVGCGKDDETAGDKAKAATDAVVNKTDDIVNAVKLKKHVKK
jgi:hypothetical protein